MKAILTLALIANAYFAISQLKFNPKVGLNFSNFTQHDDIFESTGSFGFTAGLDLKIGNRLFFSPGLFYVSSETEVKSFNNISTEDVLSFHTIELPLSIGYNFIDKGDLKIGAKVGIEGAYFTSISEVEDQANNASELDEDDIERLNWGVHFGAGLEFKKITFDVEFDWGQNNSFTENIANTVNPSFNRTHLLVGFIF